MDTPAVVPPDRAAASAEPDAPPPAQPPESSSAALEPEWSGDDALSEFPTESDVSLGRSVEPSGRARAGFKWPAWPVWPVPRAWRGWTAAGIVLLLALAVAAWRWSPRPADTTANTGTVAIETSPPGAIVFVDGRERGSAPLTLPLSAGPHTLTLTGRTGRRELAVTVVAGTQVVHHVELADAVPRTGRLQVSGPVGAPILLDGARRGVTPAELADILPGEHIVTVGDGTAAVTQRVTVPAGGLASLLVPVRRDGGQVPAWISVVAPIPLQVFDGESLVGSSTTNRILVLAGRHNLRLANTDLKYQTTRTVDVEGGRVATVRVDVPNGILDVNATPWAEVLVDGKRVGETPIANLAIPIGAHEVTLRNPKFPEQKRSVVISLGGATRLGVDLRQ